MDFKVLEKASETLQDKLRLDEAVPDLADQFSSRDQGSHRYYIEPYKSQWGPMIEYGEFLPFPKRILDQYVKIECASFMGILSELNRVWVTVDNKLFLWKYTEGVSDFDPAAAADNCEVFDGMTEVIVSVALSAPRPGVFLDTVKYVLVVASPVEVALLAVTCDEQGNNFRLLPTAYRMPSDNVAMVKVVGSQTGRIFMAGNDGNVYELDYSNTESVWSALLDGSGAGSGRHKCRKINHFAWNWKLVHILPPFLKGLASEEDNLVDLAVDNVRHVVYAVTARGMLSAFYLGASGSEISLFLRAFNVMDAARSYLSGYNVAEGAPRPEAFTAGAGAGCHVLSLSVLSPAESRKVHLVVTLQNGIRLYLSLRTSAGGSFVHIPAPLTAQGTYAAPDGLAVVYVRSPPPSAAVRTCARSSGEVPPGGGAGDVENGCAPSFIPAQAMKMSAALSTQAVTLLALDKQQHPDEVLCLFEDLLSRSHVALGLPPAHQLPSMREGVCIGVDETRNGGKIYDIQEDSSSIHVAEAAALRTLFALSSTPSNASIRDASHHHDATARSLSEASAAAAVRTSGGVAAWLDGPTTTSSHTPSSEAPVALGGRALHMTGRGPGCGFDAYDLGNVALLGELCWQHLPCVTVSTSRNFLVLTNQGVHFLRKVRPADALYRCLSQLSQHGDELCRQFFSSFGALEASAMCIALACGLPGDAGSAFAAALAQRTAGWRSPESIQVRAMSVMLGMTQGPTFRNLATAAAAGAALRDARIVVNNNAHEFVHSSAHDALYVVASRILRPIWLRNVVLREGAQPSITWSAQVIANIRGPLAELLKVIKGYFASAVLGTQQGQERYLALLAENAADDLITKQMLAQAQTNVNAERQVQQQARSIEDASIHALYRLVSRALQALSFIEVLASVKGGVRVPWSKLGEVSFRSLVVSARAHENAKRLVSALIGDLGRSAGAEAAQQVVDCLSRECSFYFSPGDRSSYAATRRLQELREQIRSLPAGEGAGSLAWNRIQAEAQSCVQLLLCAAKYWCSPDQVQGEESELWQRCTALLELDTVGHDGVVDVCIAAAANFAAEVEPPRDQGLLAEAGDVGATGGEGGLYRSSLVLSDADRSAAEEACFLCLVQHVLTVGSDVRRLGAGILPSRLPSSDVGNPLQVAQAAMLRMVVRCMTKSDNVRLHTMLSDRLLREHEDLLLSVRCAAVEQYLAGKDSMLLYKYYERHGECAKAAQLMASLARDDGDCEIAQRVSYLQKGVASAERAVAMSSGGPEAQMLQDYLADLTDTLEVAGLQLTAHEQLADQFASYGYNTPANRAKFSEGQRRSLDLMERAVQRVQLRLLPITALFHDICNPYKLWDICLLILGVSKHDDPALVARLWLSFIYRLVPDVAETEEGQAFLRLKRDGSRIDVDKRQQRTDVTFEQATKWLSGLHLQVVRLAQQLVQGAPARPGKVALGAAASLGSVAFPSALVLEELQELAATLSACGAEQEGADSDEAMAVESKAGSTDVGDRGWTVRIFCEIGFTYGTLVETLVEILDRWQGKSPEKLLHLLASIAFALMQWTRLAAELSARNEASTRQLVQASRSGRVAVWVEKLRRQLSTLGARRVSASSQRLIADVGKELMEVNRRVAELTVA